MGDLFSSFNPQTVIIFSFAGNWVACLSVLLLIPQGVWLVGGQIESLFKLTIKALMRELKAVFGHLIAPGALLFFQSIFMFILSTNFLGLFPYVFTRSRHLSFTLSLSLPLWLGSVLYRISVQFNSNIAHLVPVGTPGALIPVIVLIERVRTIIRPGTLAVRLAATIVAGHLLLTLLGGPRKGIQISDLTSVTETVHVLFHTDESVTRSGWRLEWSSSSSPSSEEELPTTGVLTSPNYKIPDSHYDLPQEYPNNLDQVQKIQVPEGNTIWIRFTDFRCEEEFDTVTITDKDGTRLGLFDGGENSDDDWREEIESYTDTVEVLFHTDGSGTYPGWRLEWGTVGKNGVLTSRNWPQIYPRDHISTQSIEVAEGKTIRFSWTHFSTEPEYDYVRILDSNENNLTPDLFGHNKLSGFDDIPTIGANYSTNSNSLQVEFRTDSSGDGLGWKLKWTEQWTPALKSDVA